MLSGGRTRWNEPYALPMDWPLSGKKGTRFSGLAVPMTLDFLHISACWLWANPPEGEELGGC